MPGSLVRRRSSFCAARSVPSATETWPAWMERPMPTPPPWWMETQVAPEARVEQGVEQRPVGDRVGAVGHGLGLAVRGGDGAGVEVVAADHDGRLDLAFLDELVEQQAGLGAFAVAEPADAGRQAFELDPFGGGVEPAVQVLVLREELLDGLVRDRDVLRVAGERHPAERARGPRRTAGGCRPGRSRGTRRRGRSRPCGPRRGWSCRSRRPRRRRPGTRPWPGRAWPSRPGPSW